MPWATAIGGNGGPPSRQPSTVGTKPEKAITAAGRGRPSPRPTARLITAPCEKPPITFVS